ncbi:tripartite tricarboxylate transporter substrate binding protein [uncultured Pigmentiphaga sp.]|uniref:Bug family tripartite tricarboxylate transporter substrate binding protein n=1 Tax=uncultured Pigmentiphaga sp. TaxID=340361 RepID=UPI0026377DE8|nr:tripartite tricarboxylate transporter substrate binding protein [uncultured Pigmentiphaga sp.]
MKNIFMRCAFGLAAAVMASTAHAQDDADSFPTKPVHVIVPYGAGGAADLLARTMALKLSEIWNESVIVENKPGGVGTIGITSVVRSPADGYTLVSVPVSDLAVNPHLYRKRPFDVFKDLTPVSQVGAALNVLVVSPKLGVKNGKELIALAKSKPHGLTYSSPGVGSQAHLVAAMFGMAADIKLQHIPYNGVAAALSDVVGGQIDIMFAQLPSALSMIEAGKIQAVGMASEERSSLAPDIPTLKESAGVSIGDAVSWSGLMAPAGTPLEVREKIAAAVTQAMRSQEIQQKLAAMGMVGLGGTPEELAKAMKSDSDRYRKVIQTLDITLD